MKVSSGWITGLLLLVAMLGCGDDGSTMADTETDGESSTGEPTSGGPSTDPSSTGTATVATTTGENTSNGPDGSSVTGFDPPTAECGNGFVEGDEQCDDGNLDDGDGCSAQCLIPCGLEWSATQIPLTPESTLEPLAVARGPQGQVVTLGFQREITSDQKGNETIGRDEAAVVVYDDAGTLMWEARLTGAVEDLDGVDVTFDEAGDLVVVATVTGDPDGTDIEVVKLSGADGSELWRHQHDSAIDNSDDFAMGVAVAPDGDIVVSGQVRAGDGDADVWLLKLAAADGAEIWTTTWSGVGSGTFSTDNGGPVAISDDGTIYVLAEEHVSFDERPAILLSFPADGGQPQWVHTFELGGTQQQFVVDELEVDADGDLYALFSRNLGGVVEYSIYKVGSDATELWSKTQDDFVQYAEGWQIEGLQPTQNGDLVVAGTFDDTRAYPGEKVRTVWIERTDAGGATLCTHQQAGPQQGILPSEFFAPTVAAAADGGAIVAALLMDEADTALWLGRFRPE